MLFEKIKKISEEKRIPIAQIEKAAGFGKNTIFRWNPEKADSVVPSIDKVRRVADVLGVTVNDLLDYDQAEYDPEIYDLMQRLAERPELRLLLRASKDVPKESIEAMLRLMNYDGEN